MKKYVLAIIAIVALFSLAACGNKNTVVETDAGNVTKDELYDAMKSQYGDAMVQQLVEKKLLEKKYDVTDKEVEKELEKIKEPFESDEEFDMALMQSGFESADQLKEEIRMNLLRQKATTDGIEVTDEKLKEFYDENKDMFVEVEARHILVEDEKKAKEVKEKLDNGAKFEELVKEYSTDSGSVPEGGSVGTVKHDSQLVPEFIEAALQLKEGEVSEPVQSSFGYHIIKADKRTDKTFEDSKDDVEEKYLQENARPYEEVRNELLKEANIKVNDKQFKDLFKVEDEEENDDEQDNEQESKQDGDDDEVKDNEDK